jgi:hypothetical protein
MDEKLRAELIQIARGNAGDNDSPDRHDAEQNWKSVRLLPVVAAIIITCFTSSPHLLSAFPAGSQYIALLAFCAVLAFGVYALNTNHRKAYVDLKVSQGMRRNAAEKEYSDRYSSS